VLVRDIELAAAALAAAEHRRSPVPPVTERFPDITVEDAYRIQLINVRRRAEAGVRVRGRKIGLTSRAMQAQLGVTEPDFGHLLEDMLFDDRSTIEVSRFCAPRIEPETAFVLGRPLAGPGCTMEDVLDATDHVLPVMEIIDSRIADWRITLADTIADNASSAGVVLGSTRVGPRDLDLPEVAVAFRRNGEVVETGMGSAVLGHPALAVAWLADKLAEFGTTIHAGEVVIPGSCTRSVEVRAGDEFSAEFRGLGSVSVRFADPEGEGLVG
jgi:2-keto-4-pentenoate hydratase